MQPPEELLAEAEALADDELIVPVVDDDAAFELEAASLELALDVLPPAPPFPPVLALVLALALALVLALVLVLVLVLVLAPPTPAVPSCSEPRPETS